MSTIRTFARGRRAALAATAAAALLITASSAPFPEATEIGIAGALAEAVRADLPTGGRSAEVDAADVVWEPSRGAFVDATWGRGVAFLARSTAGDGVARRDVFRARVTVAPGGRPMHVAALERRTETDLADEHSLVARGEQIAWLTRGEGGEHGATWLGPARLDGSPLSRLLAWGAGLPPRATFHVVATTPLESLRAELRDDGLVLAASHGEGRIAALLDAGARTLATSGEGPALVAVEATRRAPPAWPWQPAAPPPAPPPSERGALQGDAVFPPGKLGWAPLLEARVGVAGERPPPAPIARASVVVDGREVAIHAFDLRQLVAQVIPAVDAPRARAGLPGTGRVPGAIRDRVVAILPAVPLRDDGGAIEGGRTVAPLEIGAPTLAQGSHEQLSIGPFASSGDVVGAIQTRAPGPNERVRGGCVLEGRVVLSAETKTGERAPIERALGDLGCATIVWLDASSSGPLAIGEPVAPADRQQPFLAFARRFAFPEGRSEAWVASAGLQPDPVFAPSILERKDVVFGVEVRLSAFVAGRVEWAIRAGKGERSHRFKGVFPEALGEGEAPRALAAWGLGIGLRRSPNGLTIGGSTGHRYAGRGAVLLATPEGLRLVRSSELRGDPGGDATELPLTAEGGAPTAAARRRGLLHDRADLCLLADGTALVAVASFDSHEATAEALCRAGCSEVVALDRGADRPATSGRATAELALPSSYEDTTLFALAPGQD